MVYVVWDITNDELCYEYGEKNYSYSLIDMVKSMSNYQNVNPEILFNVRNISLKLYHNIVCGDDSSMIHQNESSFCEGV